MTAFKVVLAVGSAGCLISFATYLYLASKNYSHFLHQNIVRSHDRIPFKGKVVLGFSLVGPIIFFISGAHGLLHWMPDSWGSISDGGDYVKASESIAWLFGLVGGVTFFMIVTRGMEDKFNSIEYGERAWWMGKIAESALHPHELMGIQNKINEKIKELEIDLLSQGGSPKFTWRMEDSTPAGNRIRSLNECLHLVQYLQTAVPAFVEAAIDRDRLRIKKEQDSDAAKMEAIKVNEELSRQQLLDRQQRLIDQQRLSDILNSVRRSVVISPPSNIQKLSEGEVSSLDCSYVADRWGALDTATESIITITDNDISKGKKGPYPIDCIFNSFKGIEKDNAPIGATAEYSGDHKGGHTDIYVNGVNGKESLLPSMTFNMTIDGMIEAFYVTFELHKKGAYWHGFYGRDDIFLLHDGQLASALRDRLHLMLEGQDLQKLVMPMGIRIEKYSEGYTVSCLALEANGSIVDKSINVTMGKATKNHEKVIIESDRKIFY